MKTPRSAGLVTVLLIGLWLYYLAGRNDGLPQEGGSGQTAATYASSSTASYDHAGPEILEGQPDLDLLGYEAPDLLALGVSWYHQGHLDAAGTVFAHLSATPGPLGAEARAWAGSLSCSRADQATNPLDKVALVEEGLAAMDREARENPDNEAVRLVRLNTLLALPEFFGCHDTILEELAWLLKGSTPPAAGLDPGLLSSIAKGVEALRDWPAQDAARVGILVADLLTLANRNEALP